MAKFVAYEKTDNFVDNITGEITSKSETKVLKLEKNTEKFFKFFVESVGTLYGLNAASSFKVLFAILNMATTRDNVVSLAYGMRKRICQNIGIHLNVFARAIKELTDREILKNTGHKDYFFLNPHIFGQGSLIDVEKLRHSIEFEYDFKKGEAKRTISADSITSTGMDILQNPHKYEVSNVTKEENEQNLNIDVSVKHKGNIENLGIMPYPSEPSLPFAELTNNNKNALDSTKIVNHNVPIEYNKEKMEHEKMMKSFELTSKMLDRIKDLESSGRAKEAMSFQKIVEEYLKSFGVNH